MILRLTARIRQGLLTLTLLTLLATAAQAEKVALKEIGLQLDLPKGFQAHSVSGRSATWIHKKKGWQISVNGRPVQGDTSQEYWYRAAVKRNKKEGKVSELKVRGAVGAYLTRHKNWHKSSHWGYGQVYTKTHTYHVSFGAKPKDAKAIEKLARKLFSSMTFSR